VHIVIYGTICYPAGTDGPSPSIRGCPPASMGAANSSAAREDGIESVRFWKAVGLLVDGDLPLGTGAAEAAGRLPDYDGEDGWTACRMVFLEDGGYLAG